MHYNDKVMKLLWKKPMFKVYGTPNLETRVSNSGFPVVNTTSEGMHVQCDMETYIYYDNADSTHKSRK